MDFGRLFLVPFLSCPNFTISLSHSHPHFLSPVGFNNSLKSILSMVAKARIPYT